MPVVEVEMLPEVLKRLDPDNFEVLSRMWHDTVVRLTDFTYEQVAVKWTPELIYGHNLDDFTLNVWLPPHEQQKPSYETVQNLTHALQTVLNGQIDKGLLPYGLQTGVWVLVLEEDGYVNSTMKEPLP